ncbi:3'-5' exonuclease [Thecaphora frezii]
MPDRTGIFASQLTTAFGPLDFRVLATFSGPAPSQRAEASQDFRHASTPPVSAPPKVPAPRKLIQEAGSLPTPASFEKAASIQAKRVVASEADAESTHRRAPKQELEQETSEHTSGEAEALATAQQKKLAKSKLEQKAKQASKSVDCRDTALAASNCQLDKLEAKEEQKQSRTPRRAGILQLPKSNYEQKALKSSLHQHACRVRESIKLLNSIVYLRTKYPHVFLERPIESAAAAHTDTESAPTHDQPRADEPQTDTTTTVALMKAATAKAVAKTKASAKASPKAEAVLAKAGSNWKALKKTLATGMDVTAKAVDKPKAAKKAASVASDTAATKSRSGSTYEKWGPVTSTSNAKPAKAAATSSARPWFADDLKPEDMELINSKNKQMSMRSMQWEGIVDPDLKREMILRGPDDGASQAKKDIGNYLAVDCEMVGVGPNGSESHLARVSIVNFHGALILDRYVRPMEKVTNFRTWVSGIRPKDLKDAPSFSTVQQEVANLIKGKVLVGHAIHNDLKALMLSHPRALIRDTAAYTGLQEIAKSKMPSLKNLAKLVLDIDIQIKGKPHSSVEDARATMAVYRTQKAKWDESLRILKRGTSSTDSGEAVEDSAVVTGTRKNPAKVWQPPSSATHASDTASAGSKRKLMSVAAPHRAVRNKSSAPAPPPSKKPKVAAKSDWWKDDL